MNIIPIASSSSGNSYLIESGNSQLLIDCGVPLKKIRAHLPDGSFKNVVACLVSHEHGDHAGYLQQLEKETAVPIWTTKSCLNARGLKNACILVHRQAIHFLNHFAVTPVRLNHDVECFGFVIFHGFDGLFYATDTSEICNPKTGNPYIIKGLKYLMIEANHSFELLIESNLDSSTRKRICETHLDIDQACEFISRHPDLEEIHLIHLSDRHSDAALFKRMVQDIAGVPVYVAGK